MSRAPLPRIYIDTEYISRNPTWHSEHSRWKARNVFQLLQNNNICARAICDYGCGSGQVLKHLRGHFSQDTVLHGYEPSPQAYALCKTLGSTEVFFSQTFPPNDIVYDVLLLLDVLEHVEDYFCLLRTIKTAATYKVLHIPLELNAQAALRKIPETMWEACGHLHHFTAGTARAALAHTGYEVLDSLYTICSTSVRPASIKQSIARLSKVMAHNIAPNHAARLFAGYSLLLLAK